MAIQTKTVATGDYGWKSWSNGYVISLTLTEERTDVAANTSAVSYLFTISNTDNNRFVDNNNSWVISIGGQDIGINGFNFNLGSNYTTQTIASGQIVVPHNPDGTLHMPYNVSVPNIQSWNQYGPPAMSLSGTWELTPIPRASTVSCPVGIIGKPVAISIQKAGEGFTHTVTYAFGDLRGTVAERTWDSTVLWTIPTEFYTQIPNAKRGVGVLICKTYNGSALVGETSCSFYADIDEAACQPVISARVTDVNPATTALTGDSDTLIRYYCNAKVTAEYTAKNSAAVTGYTMTHNGRAYTADAVTVEGVENGVFDFCVTDTRGLSANLSLTKPVIPYVKLTCNLANSKPDGDGNMTLSVSGNFFAGSFGAADNSLTVQYRYNESGASWSDDTWQDMESVITGNGYTAQAELTGLDYQKAYTFQARAIDKLAAVNSAEYTARAMPIFDWGEQDFAIHGDLQLDGTVFVSGNPVLSTPHVQTCCWQTNGGVSIQSVVDFLAAGTRDCAFITFIQGTEYPFVGMAVGVVTGGGQFGAFTLYDYHYGAQSRRLFEGELYEV